jgi:hypothetical protein
MPVVLSLHDICTTLSESQSTAFQNSGGARERVANRGNHGPRGVGWVGERGPCVCNFVVGSSQFRRNVKHTQTKLTSSPRFLPPPPLFPSPPPCLTPKAPRNLAIASNTPLPQGRSAKASHCRNSTQSTPSQFAHRRARFLGPKPCAGIRHSSFYFYLAFSLTAHLASARYHPRQGRTPVWVR